MSAKKNCRSCQGIRHPEHGCPKTGRHLWRAVGFKVRQMLTVLLLCFDLSYSGRGGRKRPPTRSQSPESKRRAQAWVPDWGEVIPTPNPRADWRGNADHRAKFEILALSMAQTRLLKAKLKCDENLKRLPLEIWMKIWEYYKDLNESSEICLDWPGYCARKWGPRSHERSLNMSEAEQCKQLNWLHRVRT